MVGHVHRFMTKRVGAVTRSRRTVAFICCWAVGLTIKKQVRLNYNHKEIDNVSIYHKP